MRPKWCLVSKKAEEDDGRWVYLATYEEFAAILRPISAPWNRTRRRYVTDV